MRAKTDKILPPIDDSLTRPSSEDTNFGFRYLLSDISFRPGLREPRSPFYNYENVMYFEITRQETDK